ncbi:MAG TPA: hypothetical protein VEN81_13580 [Planctomycetota bacterium]|nr:hypothetical protein [Planctomycetota bacterium]
MSASRGAVTAARKIRAMLAGLSRKGRSLLESLIPAGSARRIGTFWEGEAEASGAPRRTSREGRGRQGGE